MKPIKRKPLSKRLGSALVMTLVIIVLITVITVGYLASVMLETKTAGSALDQERAYGVAMIGVHEAMSRVRDALGPWDDPYKNFAVTNPPFYWSVSPGRLTRFEYTTTNSTSYPLFSEASTTNLVNLNRPLGDGSHPIIGGSNAPDVSVKWVNLLRDPSRAADSNNAIIGRYAFWVDTEGSKINVNTADGTVKYTTNSLGIGSPTEVSLQVLAGTNGQLSLSNAQSIVQIARTSNFQSPREILRASGVTPDVYTNNVFSLTAYSRSPELNVFGQPRVAVSPLLGEGGNNWTAGDMVLNSLTLLPAREIYPTPSQLPKYTVSSPYDIDGPNIPRTNNPWPLSLRGEAGANSNGKEMADYGSVMQYAPRDAPNYAHNQGYVLANYLVGTNVSGQPINWPVLSGSSTNGFAGKYTPRQIDSIVAQILSIGSKAISSDYPYNRGTVGEQIGHRFKVVPYVFPGWLSRQWVIGVGRSIKVTQMNLEVVTFGAEGAPWDAANTNAYKPPRATFDFWLEWWLPTGYFGGNRVLPPEANIFFLGHRDNKGVLNAIDVPRSLRDKNGANRYAAPLPKEDQTFSYWGDQLLRNFQGIDFAGNPSVKVNKTDPQLDRDQQMAEDYHDPFARIDPNSTPPREYKGSMPATWSPGLSYDEYEGYASPFLLTFLEPRQFPQDEWQPGEMRGLRTQLRDGAVKWPMQTNATVLNIQGGIAVKTQLKDGHFTDPDPVPLEAVRGSYRLNGLCTQEPFNLQNRPDSEITPAWFSVPDGVPGSSGNLRDRVIASVIPVNFDVAVSGSPILGEAMYLTAKVDDPLVNKFPGDWEITIGGTRSTTIQPPSAADTGNPHIYHEDDIITGSSLRGRLDDPDSYWMPRADVALSSSIADVARQTLIPRSARMPNIGYLQYVRTGIIPDDETLPYEFDPNQPGREIQHGTPFRLLSFAPSYEASDPNEPLVGQKTTRPSGHPLGASQPYPDWALLDLFYIPSTLAPYGSIYGPAIANPTTNSVETKLLYYGTYGGATAGKINPNGTVIYTTNVTVPNAVSRTLPLQAVLNGVKYNETLTGVGTNAALTNGTVVNATNIAQAIEDYVRTNGPFRMPAEICNVPDIASLRAPNNPTRNDLVRQIVGTLTTQDNVFSVWTVGQAIQKKRGSIGFDEFEAGDNILAEVRLHFIVERYVDPGADGFYGNKGNAGPDGVFGTYDDPLDANNHPFQPRYLYRVVASEEIR